jgi:hypothetical protein
VASQRNVIVLGGPDPDARHFCHASAGAYAETTLNATNELIVDRGHSSYVVPGGGSLDLVIIQTNPNP